MEEKVQAEEKESPVRRRAQIPKTLIPILKQDYLNGKGSIREIAETYNVSSGALAVRCARENWNGDCEKIVKNSIETVKKFEVSRLERLHSHEERMIKRMEKRLETVDATIDQTGGLIEPGDLRSIVSTESTVDQVIRRSLGASESKVEVSGSVELNIVGLLQRLRADYKPERVIEVSDEALLEMGKNLTE